MIHSIYDYVSGWVNDCRTLLSSMFDVSKRTKTAVIEDYTVTQRNKEKNCIMPDTFTGYCNVKPEINIHIAKNESEREIGTQ